MNLTYEKLLDAKDAIGELLTLSPPPTARLSVQISRNVRLIDQALRDFSDAHKRMLEPYTQDDKFDYEALSDEERAALDAEFAELKDTDVEVKLHPLKLREIEDVEKARPGFAIPTSTFYIADFLFVDDGEKGDG